MLFLLVIVRVFSPCMGLSPGLYRVSTNLNQLLYVIVGSGARLYSVVEFFFFLYSISYHSTYLCLYVNRVLYPWYCYLCIYHQFFIHFIASWSEENVQVCVMCWNWNLHCVHGKDTCLSETTQCCFNLDVRSSTLTAQCCTPSWLATWIQKHTCGHHGLPYAQNHYTW